MADSSSFDDELQWCIQQLKGCLTSTKSDSRKYNAALKAMKSLSSDKASMVKKRQIMRLSFGDYRKKMEEESKKFQKSSKVSIRPITKIKQPKIAKKCHSKSLAGRSVTTKNSNNAEGFRFNFALAEESSSAAKTPCPSLTDAVPVNYFKMGKSDNSFKFDFSGT